MSGGVRRSFGGSRWCGDYYLRRALQFADLRFTLIEVGLQHRDFLSVEPSGVRVYEFHPWEKNIIQRDNYIGGDVEILDYLKRLAAIGEDPYDYRSIWYYY